MMRFQKLAIYRDARQLCRLTHQTCAALPAEHADIGEMLQQHAVTVTLKIARGTAEVSREDAYRTFRICQRSAELCHSILERIAMARIGDPEVLVSALEVSSRIQTGAQTIIERIVQKLPPRQIFRD